MIRWFREWVRGCILYPGWVRARRDVVAEAEAIRVGLA